jgi:4-hydroxybenzoate polyprenyltransferase
LVLKSRLIVDVLALSILYTLRILAGGTAVGAAVSEWLLMFSLFLFLSLAFLKRSIELMGHRSALLVPGRGYAAIDIESIKTMGMASGLLSVLVFAQYIGSATVAQHYRLPELLWLEVPLLVYWITRIWFMAARGEVQYDPVVFALRDGKSYIIGACSLFIGLLATSGFDRWSGS